MQIEVSFAIISTILWAISAHILNKAFVRNENNLHTIVVGLFFALLFGTLTLTPVVFYQSREISVSIEIILAGVFTFPLATLMYYLSGIYFKSKTEFAAQFTKVKPLITLVLAYILLNEPLSETTLLSAILILVGVVTILISSYQGKINLTAVLYGLITALFWAIGEIFIKLGTNTIDPIVATWVALSTSTLLYLLIVIPMLIKKGLKINSSVIYWPFMAHGVISFGIGYSLFFYSINQIGITKTILITTFWPVLSLIIGVIIGFYSKKPISIPKAIIFSSLLFLSASLIQIVD